MFLSDTDVMIIFGIMVMIVLSIVAVFLLGVFLARRGKYVAGLVFMVVALFIVLGPGINDRLNNISLRADLDARLLMSEGLDLSRKKVLLIQTRDNLCDSFCRRMLQTAVDAEIYRVSIDLNRSQEGSENPLDAVMYSADKVTRVGLVPYSESSLNEYYPDAISSGGPSEYDLVILDDGYGVMNFVAPDLLGGDLPPDVRLSYSILVFKNWPAPFTSPAPPPDYRLAVGEFIERDLIRIPLLGSFLASDHTFHPKGPERRAFIDRMLCPSILKNGAPNSPFYHSACE